jgi:hypothetical protein
MATNKMPSAVSEIPAASPKPVATSSAGKTAPPATPAPAAKAAAAKKVTAAAKAALKPTAVKPGAIPQAAAKVPAKSSVKKGVQPKPVVQGPVVDAVQRANYIEVAAYYIAQRRGFTPGDAQQDYLNAAAEIDQLIAAGHFSK